MNLIIERKQHGKYAIRDEHTGGFTYNRPCEDFDALVTQLADLLEVKDFVTRAILEEKLAEAEEEANDVWNDKDRECDALVEERDKLEGKCEDLESVVEDRDNEIRELNNKIEELEAELAEARKTQV